MSAYVATGRIERVSPRLVFGRSGDDGWAPASADTDDAVVDLADVGPGDPLIDRLAAARERWSQLTFFLFDAEGWR